MPWFRVDDSFHSHPKVLATDPAALGLWVLAGSWSSAHLTEGVVQDDVLPRLLPDAATLARKLVAAGLWKRIRGGYQFHDWADRNPTKESVTASRKSNAERQKRWREAQRNGSTNAVTNAVTNSAPTRPDPIKGGNSLTAGNARASPSPEPPRTCPKHTNDPDPPSCGACAATRSAHDRWAIAEADRKRLAPKCPQHRGQPRHNCAGCRADQLAADTEGDP